MKWFALLLLLGFLSALDSAVMRQRRSINSDAPEPNQKPGMALYGAGAGGGTHTLVREKRKSREQMEHMRREKIRIYMEYDMAINEAKTRAIYNTIGRTTAHEIAHLFCAWANKFFVDDLQYSTIRPGVSPEGLQYVGVTVFNLRAQYTTEQKHARIVMKICPRLYEIELFGNCLGCEHDTASARRIAEEIVREKLGTRRVSQQRFESMVKKILKSAENEAKELLKNKSILRKLGANMLNKGILSPGEAFCLIGFMPKYRGFWANALSMITGVYNSYKLVPIVAKLQDAGMEKLEVDDGQFCCVIDTLSNNDTRGIGKCCEVFREKDDYWFGKSAQINLDQKILTTPTFSLVLLDEHTPTTAGRGLESRRKYLVKLARKMNGWSDNEDKHTISRCLCLGL